MQVPIGDKVMANDLVQRLEAIENLVTTLNKDVCTLENLVITLKQDVCTLQRSLTEIKGVLKE